MALLKFNQIAIDASANNMLKDSTTTSGELIVDITTFDAQMIPFDDANGAPINYFTTDTVEDAIKELATQIGGTSSTVAAFTEDNVLADNDPIYSALDKLDMKWGDLASVNNGEGGALVGVEDAGGFFTGTNVESVLQEIGTSIMNGISITDGTTTEAVALGDTITYSNGLNVSATDTVKLGGTLIDATTTLTGSAGTEALVITNLASTAITSNLVNINAATTDVTVSATERVVLQDTLQFGTDAQTASYTVAVGDNLYQNIDATGAAVTATLPAAPETGDTFTFTKVDASANGVTISGNGNNVGSAATYAIANQFESVTIQFDGTQWVAISSGGSTMGFSITDGTTTEAISAGDTVTFQHGLSVLATDTVRLGGTLLANTDVTFTGDGTQTVDFGGTGTLQDFTVKAGDTITLDGMLTEPGDVVTTTPGAALGAGSKMNQFVDSTAGAVTVQLPATPANGDTFVFTKTDASGNAVTVDGNGSTIEGAANATLTNQYDAIELVYTGTEWVAKSERDVQAGQFSITDGTTTETVNMGDTIDFDNGFTVVATDIVRLGGTLTEAATTFTGMAGTETLTFTNLGSITESAGSITETATTGDITSTSTAGRVITGGTVQYGSDAITPGSTVGLGATGDYFQNVDTSGGAGNITLPAAPAAGDTVVLTKTTADANVATIVPTAGTIDGGASLALTDQGDSVTLYYDGTQWISTAQKGLSATSITINDGNTAANGGPAQATDTFDFATDTLTFGNGFTLDATTAANPIVTLGGELDAAVTALVGVAGTEVLAINNIDAMIVNGVAGTTAGDAPLHVFNEEAVSPGFTQAKSTLKLEAEIPVMGVESTLDGSFATFGTGGGGQAGISFQNAGQFSINEVGPGTTSVDNFLADTANNSAFFNITGTTAANLPNGAIRLSNGNPRTGAIVGQVANVMVEGSVTFPTFNVTDTAITAMDDGAGNYVGDMAFRFNTTAGNTASVTLPQVSSSNSGQLLTFYGDSVNDVGSATIIPNAADHIGGNAIGAAVTVNTGEGYILQSDGVNSWTIVGSHAGSVVTNSYEETFTAAGGTPETFNLAKGSAAVGPNHNSGFVIDVFRNGQRMIYNATPTTNEYNVVNATTVEVGPTIAGDIIDIRYTGV